MQIFICKKIFLLKTQNFLIANISTYNGINIMYILYQYCMCVEGYENVCLFLISSHLNTQP